MKVVILAGGRGTRISEESHLKPKPMVEIGGMPILWHIMKIFSHYGHNEFVICAGYKQYAIKEYFADYFLHNSDVTFDFTNGKDDIIIHNTFSEPWKVTVIDTGLDTMTGGRVRRVKDYLNNESFLLTYGDGVADIDVNALISYHDPNKIVTISAYNVAQRFGVLDIDQGGDVLEMREKADTDGTMINIGYMVCEPQIFDYLHADEDILEQYPLRQIAAEGKMQAYRHMGFWQCMDTLRDKEKLEQMWSEGNAPWKLW